MSKESVPARTVTPEFMYPRKVLEAWNFLKIFGSLLKQSLAWNSTAVTFPGMETGLHLWRCTRTRKVCFGKTKVMSLILPVSVLGMFENLSYTIWKVVSKCTPKQKNSTSYWWQNGFNGNGSTLLLKLKNNAVRVSILLFVILSITILIAHVAPDFFLKSRTHYACIFKFYWFWFFLAVIWINSIPIHIYKTCKWK